MLLVTSAPRWRSVAPSPNKPPMADPTGEDFTETINQMRDGWAAAMGVRFVKATRDEVSAEIDVGPVHLQPYGIVHGGVHAGLLETLASVGAALHAMTRGQSVVGLENHTSFIRAVRAGKLHATVVPLTRGSRSQLWEGRVLDDEGRLAATGRVRLLCLEGDAVVGGEKVSIRNSDSK